MCSRFVGKVAVVTASTKGIGFAIAKRLGQEGACIVISSRKEDNVRDAVSNLKKQGILVEGIACHVGKESEIDHLFKRVKSMYGGLDIFVSNAAANPSYGDLLKISNESWNKIFEVNVKSSWLLCKAAIPLLQDRSGGCIILVSSIAGYIPMEMLGAYSVSKTSLIGMVKALVPGCAKRNIRVNGIAPGIIQTNFSSALWNSENVENILSQIPMKSPRVFSIWYCKYPVASILPTSEDLCKRFIETMNYRGSVPLMNVLALLLF